MSSDGKAAADRWQELMKSMDPVSNLNMVAEIWRQAADASDRVVAGAVETGTEDTTGEPSVGPRDFRRDIERAVDQMSEAAKQFFGQLPWSPPVEPTGPPTAEVAVADGVGTTEISVPATTGRVWTPGAARHDGATIPAEAVTFWPSAGTDTTGSRSDGAPGPSSYIVKVAVDNETDTGLYHGQILAEGAPGFLLVLQVKVVNVAS